MVRRTVCVCYTYKARVFFSFLHRSWHQCERALRFSLSPLLAFCVYIRSFERVDGETYCTVIPFDRRCIFLFLLLTIDQRARERKREEKEREREREIDAHGIEQFGLH